MGADPYRWLENVESKRVRRWALSRNKKCQTYLGPLSRKIGPEFARIYDAPVGLALKVTTAGIFNLKRENGVYTIRLDDRPIVSSEQLGPDSVIQQMHADDQGRRMSYSFSKGEDEGTTRIIDISSKKKIAELKGTISSIVFTDDGFYYVKDFRKEKAPDGTSPPTSRVMRDGKVVFGGGVPSGWWISARSSHGKALVTLHQWSKTDVYVGDLDSPQSWRKAYGGNFLSYPIGFSKEHLYLLSYEGGGFGRILRDDGVVIVGESAHVIERANVLGGELVASYSVNCASQVRVLGLDGNAKATFEPPFKSAVLTMDSDETRLVFAVTSYGVPYVVYQYSEGAFRELERQVVEDIPIREGFVNSKDGTRVHYFIAGNEESKGVVALGYGGFSIPSKPYYEPTYVQFARLGFAFVVANLRGGNEYGERWHEAGKGAQKQNVFDDFAAVIGEFRERGHKVVAWGRSNGGLLVGAVMTQHPDLLDGVVIGYPVLDMMRFHKLSVGKYWVDEYGNPDKPDDRKFLKMYSPYHNLRRVHYPPTMIYTSLHDDRVHPSHAFKFAAAMEKKGSTPWLRVQAIGGHAGSSPRVRIKELTDVVAFIQKQLV